MGLLPIDGSTKTELEELIKAILKTFTVEYVKWSAIYMVQEAQEKTLAAGKKKPKLHLLKRPEGGHREPAKSGWVTKEGSIVKNWKRRYLVAHANNIPKYYEKEEDVKNEKKKAKGEMSLCGYSVNTDPNAGILRLLKQIAEKMGMDLSELPKPKEYPPFTIELYHWKRRCYYITCDNEEDFNSWVKVFRDVCWNAPGLTIADTVHRKAFNQAVRRTRWELGRWGWWSYGGSEEQILAELITDQIEWAIMGRVYSKISGPWIIRSKIRDHTIKFIDGLVLAAVKPAWAAMYQAVKELKPKVEPALSGLGSTLGDVELQLRQKITEGVMDILNPLLDKHVSPHLAVLFDCIREPMKTSYANTEKFFSDCINLAKIEGSEDDLKKDAFRKLDCITYSLGFWECTRPMDAMYNPLWDLSTVFPDISPWWSINRGQWEAKQVLDNAVYTYQKLLLEDVANVAANKDTVKALVLADFKKDAYTQSMLWYARVFKKILMPPLKAVVMPAVKEILEPLNDIIPGPAKQFVNVYKIFDGILNNLVDALIEKLLESCNNAADQLAITN